MTVEPMDRATSSRPAPRPAVDGRELAGRARGRRAAPGREGNSRQDTPSKDFLDAQIEKLNRTLRTFDKRLSFRIHDKTQRMMVSVIDVQTEEVLREIPPEEILNLVARVHEMVGIIVDEQI